MPSCPRRGAGTRYGRPRRRVGVTARFDRHGSSIKFELARDNAGPEIERLRNALYRVRIKKRSLLAMRPEPDTAEVDPVRVRSQILDEIFLSLRMEHVIKGAPMALDRGPFVAVDATVLGRGSRVPPPIREGVRPRVLERLESGLVDTDGDRAVADLERCFRFGPSFSGLWRVTTARRSIGPIESAGSSGIGLLYRVHLLIFSPTSAIVGDAASRK